MDFASESGSTMQGYDNAPKMIQRPTLKFRLEEAVKDAEDRLRDAKRAREIFDQNPGLEELLNIMQRGRF